MSAETPEPNFTPGNYVVKFDRIGRHHDIADLNVHAESGPDFADAVYRYADRLLGSSDVDVDIEFTGGGRITAGIQPAGTFNWELADV